MIILNVAQRTDEWMRARLGRLTGSVAGDMLAKIKSGEAAKRRNLRVRLVCERLTGRSAEDRYVSKEMQRGIDREPDAIAAYEARTGSIVRTTGFIQHPALMAGCSLDGDVDGGTGIIEVKCPLSATHLEYITEQELPREHVAQLLHNLWISGAQWGDFVSFDDRFPPPLDLLIVRMDRDEDELHGYELAARFFLGEVETLTADLRQRIGGNRAT